MHLKDILLKTVNTFPDRTVVTHEGVHYTYRQLHDKAYGLSCFLENSGYKKGDRIGLLLENSFDYIVSFFAVTLSGFVVVPIDTSAVKDTIEYICNDCNIETLITEKKFRRLLSKLDNHSLKNIITTEPFELEDSGFTYIDFEKILNDSDKTDNPIPVEMDRETYSKELAAIFYTSGSTGQPKGVMLSHENLISNTEATVEYLNLSEHDSVIVILPFYYIYGNSLMLVHVAVGGRLVIDNSFMYPESVLDNMEKEKVTGFSGVPSNFMILLHKSTFAQRKFEHLRYVTQAGGAMPVPVIKQLMEAIPGKEIFIMYGQTEASPRVTYLPPNMLKEKIGSIGIALSGMTVEIVNEEGKAVPAGEEGELVIDGPNVMMGYWNNSVEEEGVLVDGKLFTGDLGKKDDDGYIYIVGRIKEIIKTGGNRVSTKEIEDCLMSNESIAEATVLGVEDDILGETIKAVVVLKDGYSLTEKDLHDYCRKNLASHKLPAHIVISSSLPKLKSGKVNKLLLKNAELNK